MNKYTSTAPILPQCYQNNVKARQIHTSELDLIERKGVLLLQQSQLPNKESFAIWDGSLQESLSAFTLCYRIKIFYYRPEVTVFSYIDQQFQKIRTDHNRRGIQVVVSAHGFRIQTDIITPLMHWAAFCFALDATDGFYAIYFNGEKWNPQARQNNSENKVSAPDFTPKSTILMGVDGTVVLGQDQDAPADVYDATQSFSGEVADVNVWSRVLSDAQMAAATSCKGRPQGDVLAWDTASWTLGEDTGKWQSDKHECKLLTIGEVADVNVWSRVLSDAQMAAATSCKGRPQGDVLAWDTASWTLGEDTGKTFLPLEETCDIKPLPYFLFTEKLKFSDASSLCRAFGGELATPMSPEEQEVIFHLALENGNECTKDGGALMWLGIGDEDEEGVWKTDKDKTKITYFNWAQRQPNGDTVENCAVMEGNIFQGRWSDQSCRKSFKECPMCTLAMPVFLRFRGICDANLYDDRFILAGKRNSKPYFRGYYRSQLYFSADGRWRLENIMQMNDTYALMVEKGSYSYPIGSNNWVFSHGFCGEQAGVAQSLTLSQCAKNTEFTCNDGTCIPINQVCDRREQCPDLSDELDCSTVNRPRGYQNTLPPPSGNVSAPLPVYLNLTLSSFGNIDAVNNRFIVDLVVRMIWKDQRLFFKHLRRDRHLNIILPKEAQTIWVPTVDFLNAENNQHTKVDQDCKITIKRLGKPLPDDIEHSKEARIYEGSENYIRISRKYTVIFRCDFNFFYFPFNTDYCNMEFRINKNTKNYVSLEKYGAGIHYKGKDQLTEYAIGGMYMERLTSEEPYSGLVTVIMMQHLYATQLVTIFVPTTLINLISFATFCFKWFDFQNRIIVSLTALLVLSTLFGQIADHLPRTSYFKLIDIWFFGSILFSFVIIIIHTLVEFHHHYASPNHTSGSPPPSLHLFRRTNSVKEPPHPYNRAMLINRWGCLIITGLYVIFFLSFWVIAFLQKVSEKAEKIADMEGNITMIGYPD
ncbi:uncharacterized protein LOC134776794 [Penaeus indicus]|uniref:uncharacterized protein LOC134776794 n=1 Tax=Penaeus indicus TaxID=29960 RepID=UPI00300D3052